MTRFFVADDKQKQRDQILWAIKTAGFDPRGAAVADSDVAAERLIEESTRPFDVAVIDLCLISNGLDDRGVDVIRLLRARYPECYIFAVSGYRDVERAARAELAGASEFISFDWPGIDGVQLLANKLAIRRALKVLDAAPA
jgi:ActR/RegA family two-component response regulator